MKINTPLFEKAWIDSKYSKPEFVQILKELIEPTELVESDEIVISSILFSINESGADQFTLIQLIQRLELNKNTPSKHLIEKILSNEDLKSEYYAYKDKKKKENRKWYLGFGAFILVASGLVAYKFDYIKMPIPMANEGAKVVVLDTAKLALSATAPYIGRDVTPQQIEQISTQYRENLQREISKYTDNGYIIINRTSVYVTSPKNDITDAVIRAVGLTPVNQDQFDSNYSSQDKYNVLKSFAQNNLSSYEDQYVQEQTEKFNQTAEANLNSEQIIVNEQGQSIDLE